MSATRGYRKLLRLLRVPQLPSIDIHPQER